jgi:PAS domain S-box-containing protein
MTDHVRDDDLGGEPACAMSRLEPPTALTAAMLAELVTRLADAVIVADPDGRIVFWNQAATRVFGYSADESLGATLDLIIPERLRDRHWSGYQRTMATGDTSYGDRLLEVPALHRDGHTLSIAFTVTLLCAPGTRLPIAIAAVIRDDTARWNERRALRAEVASLRRDADPGATSNSP